MGRDFCFRWLLAAALALAGASVAQAEVASSACITRLRDGDTPARMIAAPARFDCRRPQTAWGPGDFWALDAGLPSRTGVRPTLVRIYSMWQDDVALWAGYADGRVVPVPLASRAATLGTAIEYAIPAHGVPVTRLLWRVRGAQNLRGVVMGVRLVDAEEHARVSVDRALQAGLMAGLCIAFMFFSIALWAALRRGFLIAHAAMVGGLLLYLLADAGAVRRLFPTLGRLFELRLSGVTFTLCVLGGLWFARTFAEPGSVSRRVDRFARDAAIALLAVAIVKEVLAPWQAILLDRAIGLALVVALGSIVAMGWQICRRSSALRWVWPITAMIPATLIAMRVSNTFQLLAHPFAVGGSVQAVMTSGMFVSALAIAYRVHRLVLERDEARAREGAARLLADTDPLTGLMNRRSFLTAAIGREGAQLLLVADLDHFKAVNDTIGHDGGDEVLRGVAQALGEALPPGTLVARIGGEEFAIVADAGAGLSARTVVEALRGLRLPFDLAVTASIGACTGPLATEADWKRLYRQADQALYAAKEAGRDRIRDAGVLPLAA